MTDVEKKFKYFNGATTDLVVTETDRLIPDKYGADAETSSDRRLWRHWAIGPVVFFYFYAFFSFNQLMVEYAKKVTLSEEFEKANLSDGNVTTATCTANVTDPHYQIQARATERAADWVLYISLAHGIPSIFSNLILGSYTDSRGRKFLLLVGVTGTFLRLLLSTLVIYFEWNLTYLVLASVIDGCTGQHLTTLQTALAYVSDITNAKTRIFGMLFLDLAIGLSVSSASFATGYIVESNGYSLPIIISTGLLLIGLLIVVFILPETRTKDVRQQHQSFVRPLQAGMSLFVTNKGDGKRWKYRILLAVVFFNYISNLARIPIETLFQMASPFCWSVEKVGVYTAVRTLVIMLIGIGLTSQLRRCVDEVSLSILCAVSYAACFYWTAFVQTDLHWYLLIFIGCLGPIGITMQRAIFSLLTHSEKQGAIFAVIISVEVVCSLISTSGSSAIYAVTVETMPGLVFLLFGSCDVVCLLLLIFLKIGWRLEQRTHVTY